MRSICKIAVLFFVVTGCAGQRMMEQTTQAALFAGDVAPQQLMEKNGKVHFTYTLKLPAKAFDRDMVVKLTPTVTFNGQTLLLEPLTLQGQAVHTTAFPVVKYREPFQKTWNYEFAFRPEMEKANLVILIKTFACGKARWNAESLVYTKGITPQVRDKKMEPAIKHADMTGEIRAIVMFPISKATISSGQDYMKYVKRNLDTVMAYPGAEITGIEILTSCSPDGEAWFNKELGEQRYTVARQFFETQLGLSRFAAYNLPGFVTRRVISENWQGLYNLLEDSHIPSRYDLIKQLKAVPNAEREQLLLKFIHKYPIIKDQYLPLLRNTQLIILYKMPWHKLKTIILPGVG